MGPSAVIKEVIERSPRMKSKQSLESTRSATLVQLSFWVGGWVDGQILCSDQALQQDPLM